jgi:hypothetical protein
LNSPTPTVRTVASALALPERTSCAYCRPLQEGMRSGAARSSSVAELDGELVNPEPPAAPGQHLGHERQAVELAVLVERG